MLGSFQLISMVMLIKDGTRGGLELAIIPCQSILAPSSKNILNTVHSPPFLNILIDICIVVMIVMKILTRMIVVMIQF